MSHAPSPTPDSTLSDAAQLIADKVFQRLTSLGLAQQTWYTTEEAAAYLRLNPVTLALWRSKNQGPAYRVAKESWRTILYHREDLDAFMREPSPRKRGGRS